MGHNFVVDNILYYDKMILFKKQQTFRNESNL